MTTTFDPTTYVPRYGPLAGFALAQGVGLTRFEALLTPAELAGIDARLVGLADAAGWRQHLIYDACVARLGSWGKVVEALGEI